jgi:hypothetical protein
MWVISLKGLGGSVCGLIWVTICAVVWRYWIKPQHSSSRHLQWLLAVDWLLAQWQEYPNCNAPCRAFVWSSVPELIHCIALLGPGLITPRVYGGKQFGTQARAHARAVCTHVENVLFRPAVCCIFRNCSCPFVTCCRDTSRYVMCEWNCVGMQMK